MNEQPETPRAFYGRPDESTYYAHGMWPNGRTRCGHCSWEVNGHHPDGRCPRPLGQHEPEPYLSLWDNGQYIDGFVIYDEDGNED